MFVLYIGRGLFIHCGKKAPLIVTIVLLLMVVIARDYVIDLSQKIEQLESREPVIVYQVDNAGAEMIGTITGKEVVDGRYTVDAGPYGKFLVTEEQFESLEIGDEIPDYLKQRGINSNDKP